MTNKTKYKRVLLKLSGESLSGENGYGIDLDSANQIASEIKGIHEMGVEICIVIGGGNIFRGMSVATKGMDRAQADYMGMLATVMNAMALQDILENQGVHTRVQSAIQMNELVEPYIRRRAVRHLEKDRVVIFAGGTGNPFFTTDTAASLRSIEMHCDVIFKATKVDGVYDKDPKTNKDATMFDEISFLDVLNKDLKVMDATAISLCMDNSMPIQIFNIFTKGNLKRAVSGEAVGTLVKRSS